MTKTRIIAYQIAALVAIVLSQHWLSYWECEITFGIAFGVFTCAVLLMAAIISGLEEFEVFDMIEEKRTKKD